MHPRTTELLDHLDHTRADLRAAVDSVPVELRSTRPIADRWSVAEVLEHLSIVERRVSQLFVTGLAEGHSKGLGPEQEESAVLSTFNFRAILDRSRRFQASDASQPKGDVAASAAWAALQVTRATFRAAVVESDGVALGEIIRPHPVLGPINLYQWVAFVSGHEGRHTAQIREIGAQLSTQT